MKIVLVSPFTPPLVGGLENVCALLATGLRDSGHEVAIVGQFAAARHSLWQRFVRRERARTFAYKGLPVSILQPKWPGGGLAYALLWQAWSQPAAVWFLQRWFGPRLSESCAGADIVHYLGTGTDTLGFATAAAARAAGALFCVQPAIHAGTWGDRLLDAELYRGADGLLAFSAAEEGILRGLGVASGRIHRVAGGVEWNGSSCGNRFRERSGIKGPLVLFLGRRTADKGVDRLLSAWPAIRQNAPAATLVFMGPAADCGAMLATPGVVDVADASEQEKHDALEACDLLCVPSVGESFGLAYLEAGLHGKPVVGLDLPALRETISEAGGGLLVDPDPAAIAAAVIRLLGDADMRATMGQCGRQWAERHTVAASRDSYTNAYARMLAKSGELDGE
jgi:glycosyltransferase involved in cell wall biosynthesis